MTRFSLLTAATLALAACSSSGTNPVTGGDTGGDTGSSGGLSNASISTLTGPESTQSPTADGAIHRQETEDSTGNGFAKSFAYDAASDTFSVDNLGFDGDNAYKRGTAVGDLGPFKVYESAAVYADDVTGAPIGQFLHRAIYGVSASGQARFAIVRTGSYLPYGFGGFMYERDGKVTLPASGQAQFTGDYAALRDFNGAGGLEYAKGKMDVAIDLRDFNDGNAIQGHITDRQIYRHRRQRHHRAGAGGAERQEQVGADRIAGDGVHRRSGRDGQERRDRGRRDLALCRHRRHRQGQWFGQVLRRAVGRQRTGRRGGDRGAVPLQGQRHGARNRRLHPLSQHPLMRLWAAAAVCVLLGAAAVRAEPLKLDAAGMRQLGLAELTAHHPDKSLAVAEALLQRDPGDVVALILKSRSLRDLGRYAPALQAARQAWSGASTGDERYGAALAMAQALSSQGARTRAQFWLRRAVQAAPTPLAHEIAVRDFDYVRSRNPLSFSVQLSVSPSSNVNGGSSSTTTELLGLPFLLSGDARALSGFEAAAGLSLRWRRPVTPAGQTEYRLGLLDRRYALSADAKAQAPGASGSDYDYEAIELGWSRRFTPQGSRAAYTLGATAGRNWYGHDPLSRYLRFDLGAERPLGPRMAGQLRLWDEEQWRDDDSALDARTLGLRGRLLLGMKNNDRLGLSLGYRDTGSDSISVAHHALTAGIDWSRGRPFHGIGLAATLDVERRDYPRFPFTAGGRQDLRVSGELSLTFQKVEYLGFSPVLTISAAQTRSTLGLYDSRELGIGLGFSSAF